MKLMMRLHRYLSCVAAPAMIFFAITGAWQAFRLNDSAKDGSYTAPALIKKLSALHKADHLSGTAGFLLKSGFVFVSVIFLATAVIGIVMAFKVTKPAWRVWACLIAGVVIPMLLAALALNG